MKNMKRFLSILLTLCMLVGTIGVLPVSAIEYSSDYAISNVTYVPTGTLGSTQDMLQWSDVGAASYRLEIYDENDILIDYVIQNENYIPAAQILPYSGKFYVVVVPLDENNVSVWSGTASDMFTYTDTTAPTVAWLEDETVRSNDSEATVQFNNFDHLSACTYYYAVVDNGATAPTIDTSGTGIAANDSSDNYINLTDLTAGAKDIYLILKDQDGNASEPIKTTIPAYVPPVRTFQVTFDTNGQGTAPASQTVNENGTASQPADPTAEGYTFGGWYTDAACTAPYDFSTAVTGDITLYAKWSAVVASACTCETRCLWGSIATGCPVCTEESISGCMGTPTLEENGQPWRLSDTEAEVGFYGSVNPNVTWKYYYILTDDSTAQPTASDILASGTSGVYEDPHTLTLTELTAGEKYIHIVLRQEEQDRTTNVLRLTIPAFVKLTLTPSADGGDYDAESNTLTIYGGGTVNFTLNAPGYVHCDNDETIEATPLGDDPENATEWTVTLPATPNTYTFYYGLGGQEAWCTVVVVEEATHQHSYSSEWSKDTSGHWYECECGEKSAFAEHTSSGAATEDKAEVCTICGYEISPALGHQHSFSSVWLSDASGHWHKCSCGATSAFAEHTSSGAATEDAAEVCTVCGYEISPKLTHTHSFSSVWLSDAFYHWRECSCGGKFETAEHSGPTATATTPQTCTVCGYEIAPVLTDYTLTLDYFIVTESGVEIGAGLSDQNVGCPAGDVVDLSGYWRDDSLEVTGSDGKTYYFGGFVENSNGNGILVYSTTMNSNKTLYANWVFDKQITVILDTQSGILPYRKVRIAEKYAEISEMNSLHKPVRAGYDFVGWSVEDDGVADSGDTYISDGWPIYAVWQTYMPSYDDDFYDPPPASIPVEIGGDYDAVRISDGVIGKIIDNGNEVVVKFPDGTSGTLTDSALVAAKDNLQDGESLQIAIKNVGSEVLPDSLTKKGPYGGSEAAIDKSIFEATGIENIEDRLKTLGLINGNTDSSVTEDEFEYLYHYLTTDELTALKNELNESAHFEHHQNAVNWLTKMIERDEFLVLLNQAQLKESGIWDKLIETAWDTNGALPLGWLRRVNLSTEQLKYIKEKLQAINSENEENQAVLAWANEAIAQKELEALYAQMDEWIGGLSVTDYGGEALDDAKLAAESMTTAELERFLENARETNIIASSLALGDLIGFLEDELQTREASDTPTYVQVGGTSDGINPLFIGAVDVNIGAVKVDGTTTPIAIKADRSDAVAWSTNVSSAAVEEMLAMLGAATTEDVVSNIKAYKVLDNGTLEARASKVTVNADGTLTLSAMSDGNSTYVFLYEPAKVSEEHTHNFEWVIDKEATETEDGLKHEECACGAKQNENTVIPKTGSGEPDGLSIGWIIAIIVAAVAVIGGGAAWVIYRKKRRAN